MSVMKKLTIKEIKEKLQLIEQLDDPFVLEVGKDERKGVQTALKQLQKRVDAKQALKERFVKMSEFENKVTEAGYQFIAGIDEVGRGPLAGPVVAAAVILDRNDPIIGLDDSKKLSLKKRTELFREINEKAIAIGIGVVDAAEIDQLNILQATKKAMNQAVENLMPAPDFLLIDAERLDNQIPQESIIKGDLRSNSIAAASIIAKVMRDETMATYGEEFPGYDFASNVGYGTKAHLEGLEAHGPTPIHRKSFAPVKNYFK